MRLSISWALSFALGLGGPTYPSKASQCPVISDPETARSCKRWRNFPPEAVLVHCKAPTRSLSRDCEGEEAAERTCTLRLGFFFILLLNCDLELRFGGGESGQIHGLVLAQWAS